MRLPASFELQFKVEEANAQKLQDLAGTRLRRLVVEPNEWLMADRVKGAEAAFAKLLLSDVPKLAAMPDLYAATVIVPTASELPEALQAVQQAFPGAEQKVRPAGDPTKFIYDDVHVFAQLGEVAAAAAPAIAWRAFEIQIRTGLQFAWWRATHDTVYKGRTTRKLIRLSSQARAALELLDSILADLRHSAEHLHPDQPVVPDDLLRERLLGLAERWPAAERPRDGVRFARSVEKLVVAAGIDPVACGRMLDGARGRGLRRTRGLAPLQVLCALVVEERGIEVCTEGLPAGERLLVTQELVGACPVFGDLPEERVATV